MVAEVEPLSLEDAPELLTINELRRVLRCGQRQAYEVTTEEGLGVKVRGAWRIPREALRRYIQQQLPHDYRETMQAAESGDDG